MGDGSGAWRLCSICGDIGCSGRRREISEDRGRELTRGYGRERVRFMERGKSGEGEYIVVNDVERTS